MPDAPVGSPIELLVNLEDLARDAHTSTASGGGAANSRRVKPPLASAHSRISSRRAFAFENPQGAERGRASLLAERPPLRVIQRCGHGRLPGRSALNLEPRDARGRPGDPARIVCEGSRWPGDPACHERALATTADGQTGRFLSRRNGLGLREGPRSVAILVRRAVHSSGWSHPGSSPSLSSRFERHASVRPARL
jgi:hypothetical protein